MSKEAENEFDTTPVLLDEPQDVSRVTPFDKVIDADVAVMNNALKALHVGFGVVRSVTGLCKLIDTTLNVIKARRDTLLLPYGHQGGNSKNASVIEPLD